MILWITGNSGAGKTSHALKILKPGQIHLDGDDVRIRTNLGFGMDTETRWQHNLNVARWAKLLSDQGFDIVISVICPYEKLRQQVKEICNCTFLYLEFDGDDQIEGKPYEKPISPELKYGTN